MSINSFLHSCYTNHSLDQFLKHLLDVNIQSMIRVGGRSQSKVLEGKNLRVVRASTDKTMLECHPIDKTYSMLGESEDSTDKTLQKLRQMDGAPTWEAVKFSTFRGQLYLPADEAC